MAAPIRILLAVGNEYEGQILEGLLREGFGADDLVLVHTHDTADALAAAALGLSDVILLDQPLRGGSGVDLVRELREAGNPAPVLFLCDTDGPEPGGSALRAGATATAVKPVLTGPGLSAAVRHAMDLARSERGRLDAESAHRRSEALFRAVVESTLDVIAILSPEGTVRFLSSASRAVLGRSPEDAIGIPFTDLLHPDDGPIAAEELERLVAVPGSVSSVELRVVRPDGSLRTIESVGRSLVHDALIQGLLVVSRDITERRRSREALLSSEARYRTLFEALPDALFVHTLEPDGKVGRFVTVNDEAARRLGYSVVELLGMSPKDLAPPENETETTADTAAADRPTVREIAGGRRVSSERVHVTKDGRRIPVEIHTHAFDLDGQRAAMSIVRDISEKKRIESALRLTEERLSRVFQASPVPMAIVGRRGRVELVNRAFTTTFGYGPGDVPTVEAWLEKAFPDPAKRRDVAGAWQEAFHAATVQGRSTGPVPASVLCRDGVQKTVDVVTAPAGEDVLVTFQDPST